MGWGRVGQGVVGWGRAGHTHGRALRQLVRGHHLHVEVLCLGFAPGLHQPLQHLGRERAARGGHGDPAPPPQKKHGEAGGLGLTPPAPNPRARTHLRGGDFDVDDDGGQGRLGQLGWVVDGVGIQGHQLQRPGQLEDALGLALDLGCRGRETARVRGMARGGRASTRGLWGRLPGDATRGTGWGQDQEGSHPGAWPLRCHHSPRDWGGSLQEGGGSGLPALASAG